MTVASVCHVGDPLQLTCTASVEFLRWNVLRANEQGALVDVINSEIINSRDMVQRIDTILNSATLTFMRISAQGASPLVSMLSIDLVGIRLNGSVYFLSVERSELERKFALVGCNCAHARCVRMRCGSRSGRPGRRGQPCWVFKCVAGRL